MFYRSNIVSQKIPLVGNTRVFSILLTARRLNIEDKLCNVQLIFELTELTRSLKTHLKTCRELSHLIGSKWNKWKFLGDPEKQVSHEKVMRTAPSEVVGQIAQLLYWIDRLWVKLLVTKQVVLVAASSSTMLLPIESQWLTQIPVRKIVLRQEDMNWKASHAKNFFT